LNLTVSPFLIYLLHVLRAAIEKTEELRQDKPLLFLDVPEALPQIVDGMLGCLLQE